MGSKNLKVICCVGIALCLAIFATPAGVARWNNYQYKMHKVDDATNYNTRKQVEDTCRSYIVSYESDRLTYEQFRDSNDSEEKKWANSAKIRANKTAVTYNEYILKNSFVFDGNVPKDIRNQLEILE